MNDSKPENASNHHLGGKAKMMFIFFDEDDTFEHMPLYEAVIRRLRKLEIAGATVVRGIMGYGSQHRIFGPGTLGIPENRPITIFVVENETKISHATEELKSMIKEGLVVVVDAFVHNFSHHENKQ
jgi:PII-like signaling protein